MGEVEAGAEPLPGSRTNQTIDHRLTHVMAKGLLPGDDAGLADGQPGKGGWDCLTRMHVVSILTVSGDRPRPTRSVDDVPPSLRAMDEEDARIVKDPVGTTTQNPSRSLVTIRKGL
jgi:hypothetical protein